MCCFIPGLGCCFNTRGIQEGVENRDPCIAIAAVCLIAFFVLGIIARTSANPTLLMITGYLILSLSAVAAVGLLTYAIYACVTACRQNHPHPNAAHAPAPAPAPHNWGVGRRLDE